MGRIFGKLMTAAIACALGLACLAGCSSEMNEVDKAALNRAYMAQANTAMMQLNADLEPFTEAAAAGDVVTMEQVTATAIRDMQAFEGITAPEDMAAIHTEYAAGCKDLREALQAYVQLYRESANLDDATFNERIAVIQRQYDSGIAHIQQGDKLVTELNGALPQDSTSSSNTSASSSQQESSAASSTASSSEASMNAPQQETQEASAQQAEAPAADDQATEEAEESLDETADDEVYAAEDEAVDEEVE